MRKLLCALVLWAVCAAAQTVDGSVLNSATGVGIAGVKVDILAAGKKVYSTTTDSCGHFLIEGVKNGTYTASHSAQDYWPSDPGTPGPFQANMGLGIQAFQVTEGGNPVKLEGHMMPLPRITGRVEDGAGKGVPGARVELAGPGPGLNSFTDGEGRFEIHQFLLPGEYTLSVAPPLGLKPPDPEPEGGRVLGWTRTWYPGVAFPESAPSPKLPKIFLSPHAPRSRNAFVSLGPNASPDPDGSFSIEHVYPGLYGIYEDGDPPVPYYLDAIRMGEAEVTTEEVELSSGAMPIALVYKTNGGTLHGMVEKCAGGRVVLIPQDRAMQRSGFLRAALCDSTDHYTFPVVRPGRYYALAVPKDMALNYRKLDEGQLKEADAVTVNAGEASLTDLHLMTRPPN